MINKQTIEMMMANQEFLPRFWSIFYLFDDIFLSENGLSHLESFYFSFSTVVLAVFVEMEHFMRTPQSFNWKLILLKLLL